MADIKYATHANLEYTAKKLIAADKALDGRIEALEGLHATVDETVQTVAQEVEAGITALDLGNTYAAKSLEDVVGHESSGEEEATGLFKAIEDAQEAATYDDTALLALHADKEDGTGKMSVAEEAAAAVAVVVADAPEAFDTLKEIAEWIQKEEGHEGFDAAQRIEDLEAAVGTEGTSEEAATGLYARIEDLEAGQYTFVALTEAEIDAWFEDDGE